MEALDNNTQVAQQPSIGLAAATTPRSSEALPPTTEVDGVLYRTPESMSQPYTDASSKLKELQAEANREIYGRNPKFLAPSGRDSFTINMFQQPYIDALASDLVAKGQIQADLAAGGNLLNQLKKQFDDAKQSASDRYSAGFGGGGGGATSADATPAVGGDVDDGNSTPDLSGAAADMLSESSQTPKWTATGISTPTGQQVYYNPVKNNQFNKGWYLWGGKDWIYFPTQAAAAGFANNMKAPGQGLLSPEAIF